MGTRADFYVGRGKTAEWIGSVAWDGYPGGFDRNGLMDATDEEGFRAAVAAELASREDATTVDKGWPWPWNDSHTTDYAYAFDGGAVHGSAFGSSWFDPRKEEPEDLDEHVAEFPSMADRKAMTMGVRSGVMVIGR